MRRIVAAMMTGIVAVTLIAALPSVARAQGIDGYVSLAGDVLPEIPREAATRYPVAEFRARVFAEGRFTVRDRIRFTFAGFTDGLYADRTPGEPTLFGIARPQELHVEVFGTKGDLRVGLSRVVWGRLDEFLPTDVVNPLDLARFFLEGRSESRLPVGMVRGRLVPSDWFSLEAIYVPVFRRAQFDQLDEATSPFNIAPQASCAFVARPTCVPFTTVSHRPERVADNAQGGARIGLTTGRVDWAVSAYRGFEPWPIYQLAPLDPIASSFAPVLHERFPRFTMIGGDFETVRGEWGVRGEIAGFPNRTWQALDALAPVMGKVVEAGLGVDRKAGAYRVAGNIIVTHRWALEAANSEEPGPAAKVDAIDGTERTDVNLVVVVDRSFARQTRMLRAFAVYNPYEESAFARLIATFSLRDDVSFEASGGAFRGDGRDTLSRLATRDFVQLRLKVFF